MTFGSFCSFSLNHGSVVEKVATTIGIGLQNLGHKSNIFQHSSGLRRPLQTLVHKLLKKHHSQELQFYHFVPGTAQRSRY